MKGNSGTEGWAHPIISNIITTVGVIRGLDLYFDHTIKKYFLNGVWVAFWTELFVERKWL